jgi:thiol-disulfide isomerase/thioredoxin
MTTARSAHTEEKASGTALGAKVGNTGSLRDLRGNSRALDSFKDNKVLVLAFLGVDCPVSNLYAPVLVELEKKYRGKQVQFLAIYPNEGEDLERISQHSYDRDLPFPVLKDVGQKLAAAVGATRVPTVAVLDAGFVLCYRGRVDDQYGVAARKQKPTRNDLAEAIEEVLAGKKVSVAETEADGCLLDRGSKTARKGVTYAKEIAPILQARCQTCHRPGEAAPFSLLTYDDAARHARMIKEVTSQRRMPPWAADPRHGKFVNDPRLNRDEIETLASWVDGGMAKGDDKDLPKAIDWPQGWKLGKPDVVIHMPEEFQVPATGTLSYKYFYVDTNFDEDRWVQMAEARPGAASVVHHIVVYILAPGQKTPFTIDGNMAVLVGWAPGDLGTNCAADTALRLPKGSRLRFEMHYTPNGTAVKDRSMIGITFAKKPPKYEILMNAFQNEAIVVPPGDPHYKAEATFRVRADARILAFVPHMHWRGQDYRYDVIYPDGKRETVLSVPRWDFNWQNVYRFEEPLKLPKGSKIYSVAHWDNSRNNPLNPDASKSVKFGLQTWDEMMVGWVAYVWERPETAAELAKNPQSQADLWFDRLDRNGDDFITPEEIPEQLRTILTFAGVKLPEKMDRKEFTGFFEEMRKLLPMRPRIQPDEDKKPEEKKPEKP